MQETLTFEAMPQAILELMHKGDSLWADIGEFRKHCQPPQVSESMIGIKKGRSGRKLAPFITAINFSSFVKRRPIYHCFPLGNEIFIDIFFVYLKQN